MTSAFPPVDPSSPVPPAIGWDPDWRTPLPLADVEWTIGSPKQAAVRWMREGAPTDPLTALPSRVQPPSHAVLHNPQVCSFRVNQRVDQAGRLERLTDLVLYRAEMVARWAPAPRFFKWFDAGTQALDVADQHRLLVRCLLGAFDTDHRPVFDGLWQRWTASTQAHGLIWGNFLRQQNDRAPQAPRSNPSGHRRTWSPGRSFDHAPGWSRLRVERSWDGPDTIVQHGFRSSHPWHLPFVERAITQPDTHGGAMVQHWAATGECPVSAWSAARMGPYRELPPVAAMRSSLRTWVWPELVKQPGYAQDHGDDLLEDWLVRMIRDGLKSGAPGDATLWGRLITPWIEAGARLPHARDPNRDFMRARLPSAFEAPGAHVWDNAVMNHQNNVPDSVRRVWTTLTPIEHHLDEVAVLRASAEAVAPDAPSRSRTRL